MRIGWLVIAILALSDCASQPAVGPNLMAERQGAIDAIADRCGAPRDSWKLVSEDTLLTYFPEALSREKRLCLIYGLRDDRVPVKFAPGDATITIEEVK